MKKRGGFEPYHILVGASIVIALYLVIAPLVLLLISSFSGARPGVFEGFSLNGYARAYLDPTTYALFSNTLVFTVGSTLFGLLCGTALAWLVERTNMPFKSIVIVSIPLNIAIPGILSCISWICLLSPQIGFINRFLINLLNLGEAPLNIFSIWGMCYVQGLSFTATVFLMIAPALSRLDPSLEEAAGISGASKYYTFSHISLKLLAPALLSAAIYVAMTAVAMFEIPAMIGMPVRITVFSTKLYLATHGWGRDFALAGALSMVVLLIGFTGVYFYGRMTRVTERFATVTGKAYRPRLIDLGRWKYSALAFSFTYFTATIVLPFITLIWVSLTPYVMPPSQKALSLISFHSYQSVLAYGPLQRAVGNTVVMMLVTATLTMILSSIISWVVVRSRARGRRLLDILVFLPHGIPGIVLGLSLIWIYLVLDFIPIYGTIWIITVGFMTKFLSFGTRATNAAMLQLHRELEEAGQVSGAAWGKVFTRITLPLLAPAFLSGWLFIAIHSMRDLSIPVMLASGKNTVLAVVVWDLWNDGRLTYAAAAGVMLIILLSLIILGANFLGYRVIRKVV